LRAVQVLEGIGEGCQVAARYVVKDVLSDAGGVNRSHPVAQPRPCPGDAREHLATVGFAA